MLCLKVPTDAAWAEEALRDVDAVSSTMRTAR